MKSKAEAQTLIEQYVSKFRSDSYESLVRHMQQDRISDVVTGSSGIRYHVEISFFFDDKSHNTVRVNGSIFEEKELGPWWKFWRNVDVSVGNASFIMAPDGTFVGENDESL